MWCDAEEGFQWWNAGTRRPTQAWTSCLLMSCWILHILLLASNVVPWLRSRLLRTPATAPHDSVTMSIEGKHREVLETKRLEIVQSLNCERTMLLNYLRSHQVFDEEDCELILAEKANRARVGKLLDFLVKKGPDAYQHFLDVIQVENSSLYEALTGMKSTSSE